MTQPDKNSDIAERLPEEKYENLGGLYFPILQQDGSRVMVKISNGHKRADVIFLRWLRQHDRQVGANV